MHDVTAAVAGADNTPRYSPDGKWLAYLSIERPGFEADRQRLMLVPQGRKAGGRRRSKRRRGGRSRSAPTPGVRTRSASTRSSRSGVARTSIGSTCRRSAGPPWFRAAVSTRTSAVAPDGKTLVYLHQSNTQPAEVWVERAALTHHTDAGDRARSTCARSSRSASSGRWAIRCSGGCSSRPASTRRRSIRWST